MRSTLCIDLRDPGVLAALAGAERPDVARIEVIVGPETPALAPPGVTPALFALCNGPLPVTIVPWFWATGAVPPPSPAYRRAKRALDLVAGALLLALAAPLLAALALLIRLESPGPAFYRQQRVGRNGRCFAMLKLRTMRAGADAQLVELMQPLEEEAIRRGPAFVYKLPSDPRITRLGRWLRRTSLDELPQFLNVVRGEMSLVGPRPELPEVLVHYEPWQLIWLAAPPGLTGWWQVHGRSIHPRHLSTDYDRYYIEHASFLLDLRILARTIGVVIRGTGAF